MPLKIEDDLPEVAKQSARSLEIEKVLDESRAIVSGEINDEVIGREALAILLAAIKGALDLKPEDRKDIRAIMQQFVPSAPKKVEVTHTVKPEEYISKAMEDNDEAFMRLTAKAAEFEVIAMEKHKALSEYDAGKLESDARDTIEEGVIVTPKGDS